MVEAGPFPSECEKRMMAVTRFPFYNYKSDRTPKCPPAIVLVTNVRGGQRHLSRYEGSLADCNIIRNAFKGGTSKTHRSLQKRVSRPQSAARMLKSPYCRPRNAPKIGENCRYGIAEAPLVVLPKSTFHDLATSTRSIHFCGATRAVNNRHPVGCWYKSVPLKPQNPVLEIIDAARSFNVEARHSDALTIKISTSL